MSRPVILPTGDAVTASRIVEVYAYENPVVLITFKDGSVHAEDAETAGEALDLRDSIIEAWKEALE